MVPPGSGGVFVAYGKLGPGGVFVDVCPEIFAVNERAITRSNFVRCFCIEVR